MARLKISRGTEANVLKLGTNKTAVDGTLYFATDTGKQWMGKADGTLLQIKDGINTTYGNATQSASGLMSSSDKAKLDGIQSSADAVSFSRSLTSGTKVGTITINGTGTDIYAPTDTNTWRGVTDSYSGTDTGTSLSQKGANSLYNALLNGYANSAGSATKATQDSDGSQINTTYLKRSGGALTGAITRDTGGSNIQARNNVAIKNVHTDATAGNAFSAVAGQKTSKGFWAIGNLSGNEDLVFEYTTDTDYNSGANNSEYASLPHKAGTIAFKSDIPSSLPASDVPAWAKASTKPSYSASEISGLGNLATKSTNGSTSNFLRGDGTWVTPSYPSVSNSTITIKQTGKADQTFTLNGGATTISLNDSNTTYGLFSGTANGLAPSTASGNLSTTDVTTSQYVLTSDGKWHTLPDNAWNNSTYTLSSLGGITPAQVDQKISTAVASAYKYKGSCTSDKLPTTGQVTGDVWNLTNDSTYGKAGMNVAWNGTAWDALGSNVDLSNYALKSSIPSVSNATITIKQTGKADQTFTLNGGATTISLNDNNTTYTSLKNPYSLTIQGNGTTLTNGTYDGSSAKTVNITPSSIGAAPSDVVVVSSTQPDASACKLWIKI